MEQLSLLELFAPPRRERRKKAPSTRSTAALERLAAAYLRPLRKLRWACPRRVRVIFNLRLRSSLGRADFSSATVELNPHLLDRHPAELVPTLVHEVCHLAAGARAGHGPKWKSDDAWPAALRQRSATRSILHTSSAGAGSGSGAARPAARAIPGTIAGHGATAAAIAAGACWSSPRPPRRPERSPGQAGRLPGT